MIDPVPDVQHQNIFSDDDDDESEIENQDNDVDNVPDNPEKEMIGRWLLYLRSSTRATNDDVLNITTQMEDVVQFYVNRTINKIEIQLQENHGILLRNYVNVDEIRNSVDCNQGLHTIYNQDMYFKQKYNVVQPQRVKLGERFVPYGTPTVDGNQPIRIKKDEFIHIPISEVLPKWFENDSFFNVSRFQRRREDGTMETYMDGTHIQNHEYRNLRPNCRLIKLYFDEVDMCDAVGSKSSSSNKLGMFYWMDEDISPEHKSQLKFINLAGIVSNPHIKTYGMNAILEHIVKDIQKVENGIRLSNGPSSF